MVEKTEKFLAHFVFHLYDTHGFPIEISKERLSKCSWKQFIKTLWKHKDFLKQWKNST